MNENDKHLLFGAYVARTLRLGRILGVSRFANGDAHIVYIAIGENGEEELEEVMLEPIFNGVGNINNDATFRALASVVSSSLANGVPEREIVLVFLEVLENLVRSSG